MSEHFVLIAGVKKTKRRIVWTYVLQEVLCDVDAVGDVHVQYSLAHDEDFVHSDHCALLIQKTFRHVMSKDCMHPYYYNTARSQSMALTTHIRFGLARVEHREAATT